MNRFSLREHIPSIVVAALSAAFGVALLQSSAAFALILTADAATGGSETVALMLTIVAMVFIVIAVYVGAIVTSNTFATIIAGRTRTIALLRLIGSTASAVRRDVAREGLLVGVIGAIGGALLGTAVTAAILATLVALDVVPALSFTYTDPILLLPVVAVVLTTWLASWIGSRRVLTVTPIQATGAAEERTVEETLANRGRTVMSILLFVVGISVVVLGMLVGAMNPAGVLIGVVGGVLSFTGLCLGAHLVMPPTLRLVGRAFGSSAPTKLAAQNAVRYPERSSRNTIGLVIAVTLVTMFSVAVGSFQTMMRRAAELDPGRYAGSDDVVATIGLVFTALTAFSALIAAAGMVNNLSLSVLQRTREIGLLRALGFTAKQIRGMILTESAQLTCAAVLVGLVLGTFYGWAGAQSLLGSTEGGFIPPTVPLVLIAGVVVGAAALTWGASWAPARRATRIAPVAALAAQ
jgi:putative ABC transport system permease protein